MDKKKILEELGGLSEEIYDELCLGFVDDVKIKIVDFKSAADFKDYEKIKSLAHSLKGSAGNLRIIHIQEIALNIEQLAKNQSSFDELRNLINLLDQAVEAFKI